jgi:hypothetical protein
MPVVRSKGWNKTVLSEIAGIKALTFSEIDSYTAYTPL